MLPKPLFQEIFVTLLLDKASLLRLAQLHLQQREQRGADDRYDDRKHTRKSGDHVWRRRECECNASIFERCYVCGEDDDSIDDT
jgi:hypothetical protein